MYEYMCIGAYRVPYTIEDKLGQEQKPSAAHALTVLYTRKSFFKSLIDHYNSRD